MNLGLISGRSQRCLFNPLNAELNFICCLPALLQAHHILHVSGVRVIRNVQVGLGTQPAS